MHRWPHPNFRGGVPGGACRDLTPDIGLAIEQAQLEGTPPWGLNEDVKKCYDILLRNLIFGAAEELGCDPGLLDAQKRFYDQLQRASKYGQ